MALVTDSGRLYAWRAGAIGAGTHTAILVPSGLPGGRCAVGVAVADERLLLMDALGDEYRLP